MGFLLFLLEKGLYVLKGVLLILAVQWTSVSHISYPTAQIFKHFEEKSQAFAFCVCLSLVPICYK